MCALKSVRLLSPPAFITRETSPEFIPGFRPPDMLERGNGGRETFPTPQVNMHDVKATGEVQCDTMSWLKNETGPGPEAAFTCMSLQFPRFGPWD